MNKIVSILKKTLKVVLWVLISFVLIFILIALLIQIPAVQTKLTNYAVSYVTGKTHTKAEFQKISISFPKSAVIKGLYLEDNKQDTLLYAGEVKINLVFKALFRHKIHIKSFSLEDASININRIQTDSLFNFNFLIAAFTDTTNLTKADTLPKPGWTFKIDKVSLGKVRLLYDDEYAGMKVAATVENLRIKNASIGLENGLKVIVKRIDLYANSVIYKVPDKPEIQNSFDANNLEFKQVTLAATDLFYSLSQTEVSIKQFTATDRNNFTITKFETDFSMDRQSITATKLTVNTSNSSIEADLNIQYPSLNSLKDSIQFIIINLDIRQASIGNSDVVYFVPQLIEQPFFQNRVIRTVVAGKITGPVNDLIGKDLVITTGLTTVVKTDFEIDGLPVIETALFKFPDLTIKSTRKDIELVAGSSIPRNIELPENISLHIAFNGQIKSFESTIDMLCNFGAAHLFATIDTAENFKGTVNLANFNLGSLLKDPEMFGPVSLAAETSGKGLDLKTIRAKLKAEVTEIYLNKYLYHDLSMDGTITGKEFEGKINLNDENAMFDFSGMVNLNPGHKLYKFVLNVQGADLKKLNFIKDDLSIGLTAIVDLKGGSLNDINGKAGITNIIVVHEGKKYVLDSLLFASINEPNKSELSISSALIGLKYTGTFSPDVQPASFMQFINNYFPISDAGTHASDRGLPAFNVEIQLHNHPILSEVFLPQLKEFEPGLIQGSFDNAKNELSLTASMKRVVYGTTEISNLSADVNSDASALNFKISSSNISTPQINLDNILVDGRLADGTMSTSISSIDNKQNKKLLVRSQLNKHGDNFKLTLNPEEFFLMNEQWGIAADNYIEFGKQGLLIHHLFLKKAESQINIGSVNNQFNDDLNIEIKNFKLDDISRIIDKDTSLVKGRVDGKVLLKRVNSTYGIIADAEISNLIIRDVFIGDITVKAQNPAAEKFDLHVKLSGNENNLEVSGHFIPNGGDNAINLKAAIQSLSMKTVEAFSMGLIKEASGTISGDLIIAGKIQAPEVTGELVFNNTFMKPAATNSRLELRNESIQFKKDGIYFNSFSIADIDQHTATIEGSIQMEQFKNFIFNLQVNSQDFLLFNTTSKENKEFNGRMIIDSKIDIKGPMELPVINAKLKIKQGSNFTFAVPEDKLTTDKGEGVVEFVNKETLNPILSRAVKRTETKSGLKGIDLSSIIEIDKKATLRLLLDPASTDSLVVIGEAALSFALDRSGKMSLTGAYNLNEGSYLVSLESVIKRKFDIVPGSTITWNGDPLDAVISINATYAVRASPYDLVADQMSGLSDIEKGGYKQRYPFLVLLKLRGEILHPVISFEIQLPSDEKGILGGAVNQKLSILNEDESALNKQVFALLVLGRFIQENPLQTESGGTSTLVRSSVGKFLSAQLNQLSSKVVPGVDLNFDIQSYNDYQTGQAVGRTQLEIGLKKQLFNERLTVQVGGMVDVEGEKAKQNSASNLTSDATVEYKLTKDGRYRLKAFRHSLYEGVIEGQLVETGAGVLYLRDFDKWKELFVRSGSRKDSSVIKKQQ